MPVAARYQLHAMFAAKVEQDIARRREDRLERIFRLFRRRVKQRLVDEQREIAATTGCERVLQEGDLVRLVRRGRSP